MLMFYEPARQFEQRQDRAESQPYWAALAHLAAAEGDVATARAARERAVGLSTDPAVRRFLLRGTERR